MEKIYFVTKTKPTAKALNAIHAIQDRVWHKDINAWEIPASAFNKVPLAELDTPLFYASLEDLAVNKMLTASELANFDVTVVPTVEANAQKTSQKPKLDPRLQAALNFRNGLSKDITPKDLHAYFKNKITFFSSKMYKGNSDGIVSGIKDDELLNHSFYKTKCEAIEEHIPDIKKALTAACKNAWSEVRVIRDNTKLSPELQRVNIQKIRKSQLDLVVAKYPEKFKNQAIASMGVKAFLDGKTKELDISNIKSHAMSLMQSLSDPLLKDEDVLKAINTDKILNADLSKTAAKGIADKMPELVKNFTASVQKLRAEFAQSYSVMQEHKIDEWEYKKNKAQKCGAESIAVCAILGNANTVNATKALNAQGKVQTNHVQSERTEDRYFIKIEKDDEQNRALIKSIPGHYWDKNETVWRVPKENAQKVDLSALKIYDSFADLKAGKEMTVEQKATVFVKNVQQQSAEDVQENTEGMTR